MLVSADEDYRLHVNGFWIGGGRYRAGAGLDAYPVGDRLRPGRNRLVVELRSGRAAGGLLAALVSADGHPLLVSDARWRVVTTEEPALFRPDLPLTSGSPVQVWGEPPAGRWRTGAEPVTRTPWFGVRPPKPIVPIQARSVGLPRWRAIGAHRPVLPDRVEGNRLVFDWGRPVSGVPVLDLAETQPEPALVRWATDLDTLDLPLAETPLHLVLPIAGAAYWRGGMPVRFRYLEVVGLALERRPFVLPVAAEAAVAEGPMADRDPDGVFGLGAPWQPARAKRAVLRRLRIR